MRSILAFVSGRNMSSGRVRNSSARLRQRKTSLIAGMGTTESSQTGPYQGKGRLNVSATKVKNVAAAIIVTEKATGTERRFMAGSACPVSVPVSYAG